MRRGPARRAGTAALMVLAGCGGARAATRTFPVQAFDRISNGTPFDVHVRVGGAPAVMAQGTDAALAHLQVSVVNGTLVIAPRPGRWWEGGGVRLHVEVSAPRLVAATAAGPGDMAIDGATAPAFTVRVSGPGNLSVGRLAAARVTAQLTGPGNLSIAGLDAQSVDADVSGPGTLSLAGRAATATLASHGPGDIRAAGLSVRDAILHLNGPGGISLTATGTARGELSGPGDIRVEGGARCEIATRGPGEARCR